MANSQVNDMFDMPLRSERTIVAYRTMLNYAWLVVVAVSGFLMGQAVAKEALLGHWSVVFWAFFVVAVIAFGMRNLCNLTLGMLAINFEWLAPSKCGELADLVVGHPELHGYHQKVMALGRRYTAGEFAAIRQWLYSRAEAARVAAERAETDAQERDDCRRLYSLETPPVTGNS